MQFYSNLGRAHVTVSDLLWGTCMLHNHIYWVCTNILCKLCMYTNKCMASWATSQLIAYFPFEFFCSPFPPLTYFARLKFILWWSGSFLCTGWRGGRVRKRDVETSTCMGVVALLGLVPLTEFTCMCSIHNVLICLSGLEKSNIIIKEFLNHCWGCCTFFSACDAFFFFSLFSFSICSL